MSETEIVYLYKGRGLYAATMWRRFIEACGEEEITRCYRVARPLATESVWGVQLRGEEAGWISLISDPFGDSVTSRSGIFPAYRRQGLWRHMLMQIRREAFDNASIQSVRALVLLSNVDNSVRMLKLTQVLPWYTFDGFSLHPPAYHIITRREDWEKAFP